VSTASIQPKDSGEDDDDISDQSESDGTDPEHEDDDDDDEVKDDGDDSKRVEKERLMKLKGGERRMDNCSYISHT